MSSLKKGMVCLVSLEVQFVFTPVLCNLQVQLLVVMALADFLQILLIAPESAEVPDFCLGPITGLAVALKEE